MVTRAQVDPVGLLAHADARRCARRNDVAGMQAHETADEADQPPNAEDHVARRAALIRATVNFEPEIQILRIRYLVGRHEPRTDWAERVGALAFDPLPRTFELERALREIVDHAIA